MRLELRRYRRPAWAVVVTVITFFLCAPVFAATLQVDMKDPDCGQVNKPYCKIENAINNSAAGDTIEIASGIYIENVMVGHDLTINGEDRDTTIVDGNNVTYGARFAPSTTVTVNNMTFRNGKYSRGAGIYTYAQQLTLNNVALKHNSADVNGGAIQFERGNLTINDSIIERNRASEFGGAIYVHPDATLLTINNSKIRHNNAGVEGGAIFHQGEKVKLDKGTRIQGNKAIQDGGALFVHQEADDLEIHDSSILFNRTEKRGGAMFLHGGNVTIKGSHINHNTALGQGINQNGGGAIYANGSQMNIDNTVISGNRTEGSGGGILLRASGDLVITNSVLSYNYAGFNGGGFDLALQGTTLDARNVTISGNAAKKRGGGLFSNNHVHSKLNNVTITKNIAAAVNDPDGHGGGIYLFSMPNNDKLVFEMSNTIVAGNKSLINSGNDCLTAATKLKSLGHNIVGDLGAQCTLDPAAGDPASTDQTGVPDVMLGVLADNGGPTPTHALLEGSPAIDKGNNDSCESADQRGYDRPFDGDENGVADCDVGAYEFGAEGDGEPDDGGDPGDTPADEGVLPGPDGGAGDGAGEANGAKELLEVQGGGSCGCDIRGVQAAPTWMHAWLALMGAFFAVIIGLRFRRHKVKASLFLVVLSLLVWSQHVEAASTLKVDRSDLNCQAAAEPYCTIQAAIDDATAGDTIEIAAGLYFENLIVPDNKELIIKGKGYSQTILDGRNLGPVIELKTFTDVEIEGVTLRHGKAPFGGGIITVGDDLEVRNSVIAFNSATNVSGGGIYSAANLGRLKLVNSTVHYNAVTGPNGNGGGIYWSGIGGAFLDKTHVVGNYGDGNGAGVHIASGAALTMTEGKIAANRAGDNGGGLFHASTGELSVNKTVIRENHAGLAGAGVYIGNQVTESKILQSQIKGNHVSQSDGGGILHGGGKLTLVDTEVSGNRAAEGAGIRATANLDIERSTMSYNLATVDGGGVSAELGVALNMLNSTVSGNACFKHGAGIDALGTSHLHYVTITGNVADLDEDNVGAGGGMSFSDNMHMENSLLAMNRTYSGDGHDCSGKIKSDGYNLIRDYDDTNCKLDPAGYDPASKDITGLTNDPKLGLLKDNGGSTPTHAINEGSVAIDAADPNSAEAKDQRQAPRPAGNHNDIGAFEYNSQAP